MKKLILAVSLVLTSFVANATFTMDATSGGIVLPIPDCCTTNNVQHGNTTVHIYSLGQVGKKLATTSFSVRLKNSDTVGHSPVTISQRGAGADAGTYPNHASSAEYCVVTPVAGVTFVTNDWNINVTNLQNTTDGYLTGDVEVYCRMGINQ